MDAAADGSESKAVVASGSTDRYTWSESAHLVEVRVALPLGTKRHELKLSLSVCAVAARLDDDALLQPALMCRNDLQGASST